MTNHPILSLEVVEQIIDMVAAKSESQHKQFDDFPSLKSCALVCHSFLALCRKHIFGFVILNRRRPFISPTSDDLNQLLLDSPHLAVYIRKLDYFVTNKEFVKKRLPWLSSMLNKLVKLQKLDIHYSHPQRSRRLDWMSSSARKVLIPLLHLPTITNITLSTIRNFAIADLAGCVNLKKLRIGQLECSTGVGDFLKALPATPLMLERLALNEENVKFVQLLCDARRPDGKTLIDFSSLNEIKANIAQLDSMTELFGMCSNLLKVDIASMSPPHLHS